MIPRMTALVLRSPRRVLAVSSLVVALAGVAGMGVADHLVQGGFSDPAAESSRAARHLAEHVATGQPNLVLVASPAGGDVDDPVTAEAASAVTDALARTPHVEGVASYWSLGRLPVLRSDDGAHALVLARVAGNDDEVAHLVGGVVEAARAADPDDRLHLRATGQAAVYEQLTATSERDLRRAELLALPIVAVALLIVFGSVASALLPLVVAGAAIVTTMAVLRGVAEVTDVSVFALNLTTGLGLGLAIDYGLLVLARFRDELAVDGDVDRAVRRTMDTAGRTVAFSALTVAGSLVALLVFPMSYLRSFAYAGFAVVALSAAGALVVLPALLRLLGPKVAWGSVRRGRWSPGAVPRNRPAGTAGAGQSADGAQPGGWHRLALAVTRRPVPIAAVVLCLLLALGLPFLHVRFGQPDDRMLPEGAAARDASDVLRERFAANEADALPVVAFAGDAAVGTGGTDGLDAYAAELSALPDVARVDAATGTYVAGARILPPLPVVSDRFSTPAGTWLSVVPDAHLDPQSDAGQDLARAVRAVPAPFRVEVGGPSARLVDTKEVLSARVPLALAIIAVVTLVTLFLLFGSVLVPVKAVLVNLLSLTATFGAMVWVFQEGHGSGLLGFTPTGTLEVTTPILMFCIAFGLSMDYEVFLLARIREEHDAGADTATAVAQGLERTGRIVTAGAVLMAVVFLSFATSQVSFLKLFGIGLTLAVLMDATLIRGALVPASMAMFGRANWWAPGPLRRLHDRIGVREGGSEDPVVVPDAAPRVPRPTPAGDRVGV